MLAFTIGMAALAAMFSGLLPAMTLLAVVTDPTKLREASNNG